MQIQTRGMTPDFTFRQALHFHIKVIVCTSHGSLNNVALNNSDFTLCRKQMSSIDTEVNDFSK